jgi:hypothetical protein
MSSRASRALVWMVVAVCLGLVAAAPASGQIYAIRDENGVLTLSDKPLGEGAQTYAVRGASTVVRAARGGSEGVRSSQWDDVIDHHATQQGVRADLVRAVIQVESAFNPRARSTKAPWANAADAGDGPAIWASAPTTAREHPRRRRRLHRFSTSSTATRNWRWQQRRRWEGHQMAAPSPYRRRPGCVSRIRKAGTSLGKAVMPDHRAVDGEEVIRYSNQRPPRGTSYEVVQRRRSVE